MRDPRLGSGGGGDVELQEISVGGGSSGVAEEAKADGARQR